MGTRGRKGIDLILFGSVAEKVVKNATCPVLASAPPTKIDTGGSPAKPGCLLFFPRTEPFRFVLLGVRPTFRAVRQERGQQDCTAGIRPAPCFTEKRFHIMGGRLWLSPAFMHALGRQVFPCVLSFGARGVRERVLSLYARHSFDRNLFAALGMLPGAILSAHSSCSCLAGAGLLGCSTHSCAVIAPIFCYFRNEYRHIPRSRMGCTAGTASPTPCSRSSTHCERRGGKRLQRQ